MQQAVKAQQMPPAAPDFIEDLAQLPTYAHSHRSLTWWGMMGIVVIESTAFVLAGATYLYLAHQVPQWPPARMPAPSLLYGSLFTLVALLSEAPNVWVKRMAETERLTQVRIGLVVMSLIGLGMTALRYFEFTKLNTHWSASAYGSITVTLLGLHTVHLVTDLIDTFVLAALMFTGHAKGRRYVDTAENAIYWHFVVLAWLPLYAILYWAPRWM